MFKLPKKLILPLLLLVFLLIPASVFAKNQKGKGAILSRGEVVARDYFAAGNKVTISGVVDGDGYVAGGSVVMDGMVRGDLLVAGGTVTISGEVGQDIRAFGGTVNINGRVGRNISVIGGTVQIGKDAVIGGSIVGAFGQVQYLGQSLGDMNLVGGTVDIDGRTEGNVYLRGDSISFGDNTQVMGNLIYESKHEAELGEGAHIFGTTTYRPINKFAMGGDQSWGKAKESWNNLQKGFSVIGFLVALFIGFVMLRVFPRRMAHMKEIMVASPLKSLLIGLLFMMITPFTILLLCLTVIGIPLAFIWLFGLVIVIYFAKIVVGYWLGSVLFKKLNLRERRGWALFAGLAIYFIVRNLPYIGWLFSLLTLFAGLGIIIREKIYLYRRIVARRIL